MQFVRARTLFSLFLCTTSVFLYAPLSLLATKVLVWQLHAMEIIYIFSVATFITGVIFEQCSSLFWYFLLDIFYCPSSKNLLVNQCGIIHSAHVICYGNTYTDWTHGLDSWTELETAFKQ